MIQKAISTTIGTRNEGRFRTTSMTAEDQKKKLKAVLARDGKGMLSLASDLTKPAARKERPQRNIVALEQAVAGEVVGGEGLSRYCIRRSLRQIWRESKDVVGHYADAIRRGQIPADDPRREELLAIMRSDPQRVIYFDIETCGFSGSAVFLVGWCFWDGEDDFIVEQVLARDYAEEVGMIVAVAERFAKTDVLVSYNGKRFDLPSILERGTIHRVPVIEPPLHLDLLDHARARWKKQLSNCKLQTIEACICGRYRTGDIPGDQIPDAYHDFVKSGDARKMSVIIQHNLLDVVTLAQTAGHLIAGTNPGE